MAQLRFLILASSAVMMLSACASTPETGKDYTLKTVKWSPAPRDKFYRIVKVPKTQPACDATQGACPK